MLSKFHGQFKSCGFSAESMEYQLLWTCLDLVSDYVKLRMEGECIIMGSGENTWIGISIRGRNALRSLPLDTLDERPYTQHDNIPSVL